MGDTSTRFFFYIFLDVISLVSQLVVTVGYGHGSPRHARRQRSDIHIVTRDLK
jgi:hypothetical protein